jgi:hypothetical protein
MQVLKWSALDEVCRLGLGWQWRLVSSYFAVWCERGVCIPEDGIRSLRGLARCLEETKSMGELVGSWEVSAVPCRALQLGWRYMSSSATHM